MSEATISLRDQDQSLAVLGIRDRHLQQVRNALGIKVIARNGAIHLEGTDEQVGRARKVFAQLQKIVEQQGSLSPSEVQGVLDSVERGGELVGQEAIEVPATSKRVRPRTDGQVRYV